MTELLVKLFVKNKENIKEKPVRKSYITLASFTGASVNLFLFLVKLFAGYLSGSLSIMADAFNNLTDMSSSLVTYLGYHLSDKPADEDHPFGHGRYEYLTALVIGALILSVGFEFVKSSLDRILHPSTVTFSLLTVVILALTILFKIWLGLFYKKIGKRIDSVAVSASGQDSLNDCFITGATLLSIFISRVSSFPLDGYLGLLLSLWIIWSGIGILKDTVGPLLGQSPDPKLVQEIYERMMAIPDVTGVHDLIIHDYGPGRILASAHAEVPVNADILKIHDAIDLVERDIKEEMDIIITVHLDPISTDDQKTTRMREIMTDILAEVDASLSLHDFRMVEGDTHTNLIFDVVVPHQFKMKQSEIKAEIDRKLGESYDNYFTVITFDTSFI